MIYTIVNPSDACTIEAPDDKIATIAVLLLGEGHYGCTDEKNDDLPTLHLFSSANEIANELIDAGLGDPGQSAQEILDDFVTDNLIAIADALDSIVYATGPSERKAVLGLLEGVTDQAARMERLRAYNDEKRSSLNDIAKRAYSLARAYREEAAKVKP